LREQASSTIAILGANTVVGHVLELLLRGIGYEVRIAEDHTTGNVDELLDGVDLLLLAPGLDPDRREAFLGSMGTMAKPTRIPVLELSSALRKTLPDRETVSVAWPIRIEELAREIEAALLHVSDPST
jgi:hypothetical protein